MRNRIVKYSAGLVVICVLFVNILILNVAVHEFGHYAAARYYNLEPEVEFSFENIGESESFGLKSIPLAYTSFLDDNDEGHLFVVILLGPFMNLFLGLVFSVCFFMFEDKLYMKEVFLICMIVSFGSFIMNVLPLEGSDGFLIFEMF